MTETGFLQVNTRFIVLKWSLGAKKQYSGVKMAFLSTAVEIKRFLIIFISF
jgi:hypothetical protein